MQAPVCKFLVHKNAIIMHIRMNFLSVMAVRKSYDNDEFNEFNRRIMRIPILTKKTSILKWLEPLTAVLKKR